MDELARKIARWVHRRKEKQRFKAAKKKAIYNNSISGRKWIVIKLSGTYRVINRDQIKVLKNKGIFKKSLSWAEIETRAVYVANSRTNNINQ
jgi:hypothetical protein